MDGPLGRGNFDSAHGQPGQPARMVSPGEGRPFGSVDLHAVLDDRVAPQAQVGEVQEGPPSPSPTPPSPTHPSTRPRRLSRWVWRLYVIGSSAWVTILIGLAGVFLACALGYGPSPPTIDVMRAEEPLSILRGVEKGLDRLRATLPEVPGLPRAAGAAKLDHLDRELRESMDVVRSIIDQEEAVQPPEADGVGAGVPRPEADGVGAGDPYSEADEVGTEESGFGSLVIRTIARISPSSFTGPPAAAAADIPEAVGATNGAEPDIDSFIASTLTEASKVATGAPAAAVDTPEAVTSAGEAVTDTPGADTGRVRRSAPGEDGRRQDGVHPFVAYDCSQPLDLESVQLHESQDCLEEGESSADQQNVSYVLLQRADFLRVPVTTCRVQQTIIPLYCGSMDHQTLITPFLRIQEVKTVTAEECRQLWASQKFKDEKGHLHPLHRNRTSYLQYDRVGYTSPAEWHTDCQGGAWHIAGRTYHHVVVSVNLAITLIVEEGKIDDNGGMELAQSGLRLPCRDVDQGCQLFESTHVWRTPGARESCRYFQARTVAGVLMTEPDNRRTFISTDGSLTRVELKAELSVCGRSVTQTNYQKLAVSTDFRNPLWMRKLHPNELSVITYANQQDKAILAHIAEAATAEFKKVRRHICQYQRSAKSNSLATLAAEHTARVGGETASLGDGVFVTAAGEGYYKYRCRRVRVTGRNMPGCYSALPVQLSPTDARLYQAARRRDRKVGTPLLQHRRRRDADDTDGDYTLDDATTPPKPLPDFFMEPYSHRLTTIGIPRACSGDFAPVWKTQTGQWVKAAPAIRSVAAPKHMEVMGSDDLEDDTDSAFRALQDYNVEVGGIYPPDDVHAMEMYREGVRRGQQVETYIGERAQFRKSLGDSQTLDPGDIFPGMPTIQGTWLPDFWGFVQKWGYLASIFIGVVMVWRVISWAVGVVLRMCLHQHRYGCGPEIFVAFIPSLVPIFEERKRKEAWAVFMKESPDEAAAINRSEEPTTVYGRLLQALWGPPIPDPPSYQAEMRPPTAPPADNRTAPTA